MVNNQDSLRTDLCCETRKETWPQRIRMMAEMERLEGPGCWHSAGGGTNLDWDLERSH